MSADPHFADKLADCRSVAELDAMQRELPRQRQMTDAELRAFALRRAEIQRGEVRRK